MGESHSTTELPIRFVLTQVPDVNIEDHVKFAFREHFYAVTVGHIFNVSSFVSLDVPPRLMSRNCVKKLFELNPPKQEGSNSC